VAQLHIVQILPALDEGGVERGTVELNRELVVRGYKSTVISSGGRLAPSSEAAGGTHIERPVKSKNPFTAFSRAADLCGLLARIKPDVVHFRSRVPGWLCILANRKLRLPLVSTVHGFNSVSPYSKVMTMGDLVICPSTPVVAYIQQHYRTPSEKIRLIFRGIDPNAFDPAKVDAAFIRDFRARFGLEGRRVVLGVGRITPLKGYDALIRATAIAAARDPSIKTVIVGSAEAAREDCAASLRALVAELKMEEHVVFAGNQKKMAEIYTVGDVLVSGNHSKPESFGRTMAEALAMDRPVIATRFGGALDIVRPGLDGWLVEPGNVEELAGRILESRTARFGALRQDALARFSLDQMVTKTIAVYHEVTARR
jgi:glycosyltransferase involved in cell wall biosynthesis